MPKKKKDKLRFKLGLPRGYDKTIFFIMLLFMFFGSIMIMSAVVGQTGDNPKILLTTFIKQLGFVVISLYIMFFMANNFSLKRSKKMILIIGYILCLVLGLTLFFPAVNGAKCWIRIGSITIQPAEFIKLYMIVLMATTIEYYSYDTKRNFEELIKIPLILLGIYSFIILKQPDLGSLIVIFILCGVLYLIPSNKALRKTQKYLRRLICVGFILSGIILSPIGENIVHHLPLSEYQIKRFDSAFNPFDDPLGSGYQLVNSLTAISNGGLTGVGFGESQQKFGYLPEAQTDYIFAIIAEELGMIGVVFIFILYTILIYRLFKFAYRTKKESYKMILVGVAMYIFIHLILNIGGVSGLIPLTGIPLLFLSSGGSSLMTICAGLGICQSVISNIKKEKKN